MDRKLAIQILGLTDKEENDLEAAKKAYREIAKVIHPDLHTELPAHRLSGLAGLVNEAWAFISNGGQGSPTVTSTCQSGAPAGQYGAQAGGQTAYGGRSGAYGAPGGARQAGAGPTGFGGQQGGGHRKQREWLILSFKELVDLYNRRAQGQEEPLIRTNFGRKVKAGLIDLKNIGAIVTDQIEVIIKDSDGYTKSAVQPIRATWKSNDQYAVELGFSVAKNMRFPVYVNVGLAGERINLKFEGAGTIEAVIQWPYDVCCRVRVELKVESI